MPPAKTDRPGYLFLVCPDGHLLARHVESLLGGAGFERKVYWGDEDLPPAFWQDLTVTSLFSTAKALVIRRAHNLKAAVWDKLDDAMKGVPREVWPFLCLEGKWERGKEPVPAVVAKRNLWLHAKKKGWVWSDEGLTPRTVEGFVRARLAEAGLSGDPATVRRVASALPLDATAASLELDKLELAAGPDKILRPEHAELIATHGEMEFYDFLDQLAQGGTSPAVWKRVLDDHSGSDSMLFLLLASLAREARILWMLTSGEDNQVKPPFLAKRKAPLARRLGRERIARLIDLVMDTELAVKSGNRRPRQALDFLVAGLSDLFAAR